jgi:hypothetical protein
MHAQKHATSRWEAVRRTSPLHLRGGGKSRSHSRPSLRGKDEGPSFIAGDLVRETGIYEVLHDAAHRVAHEVVMLHGDTFPPCDTCDQRVRFRLVRTAPYIFQDEDFAE